MARIRSLKPEFWSSPNHPDDPWTRLLFMAMWNWADDFGVGTCNPRELLGFAFPNDPHLTEVDIEVMLREIGRHYGVVYYTVAARPYYYIPSWSDHQKIPAANRTKKPNPPMSQAETWLYRDVFDLDSDPRDTPRKPNVEPTLDQQRPDVQEGGMWSVDGGGWRTPPRVRARDFTEMVNGPRTSPPQPPPETHGGEVATTAGDLVSKILPRNKYGAASLTALRIQVSATLADNVPMPVVEEMLRVWDENEKAGPNAFRYQQAAAEKRLMPTTRSGGTVDRSINDILARGNRLAAMAAQQEDHHGRTAELPGHRPSLGQDQGI